MTSDSVHLWQSGKTESFKFKSKCYFSSMHVPPTEKCLSDWQYTGNVLDNSSFLSLFFFVLTPLKGISKPTKDN